MIKNYYTCIIWNTIIYKIYKYMDWISEEVAISTWTPGLRSLSYDRDAWARVNFPMCYSLA